MQITMALVAEAANRSENGRLNLLGVFHTLHAVTTPCQHPMMALVISFEATAMERGTRQKVGIKLVNADGKPVFALPDSELEVPADPTAITPQLNMIANMAGIQFENYGSYQFEIHIEGELAGRVPLRLVPPPQQNMTWTTKPPLPPSF